eukprot:g4886.t1 g4886   contig18:148661-151040(-)
MNRFTTTNAASRRYTHQQHQRGSSTPTIDSEADALTPNGHHSHRAVNTNNNTTAAATADNSTADLMSWGTSVQILDQLKHETVTLATSIKQSNDLTSSTIKNEERANALIGREYERARLQMGEYARGARDVLEEEICSEEVRRGFGEVCGRELGIHVGDGHSGEGGEEARFASSDVAVGNSTTNMGDDSNRTSKRVYSHAKFISRKKSILTQLQTTLRTLQSNITNTRKSTIAINNETSSILHTIESRKLEMQKEQWMRSVEGRKRELEGEIHRGRGVKEAIGVARGRSGENAQKIAERAKEQISERSDNISKESTASSHLETNQQGLYTLNTEANKYESELATISSLLDSFIQQNAEAGSEQKKSVAIKVDMEDVKTEIVELTSTKEEKTKAAAASNDELKAADLTLEKATAIVKELEAEKLENDKADVEVLQPALARMDAALKLQETLTAEAAAVSKATADHRHTIHKAQTDCDSKVNAVSNELREIKDNAETATCELEELKRVAANEKEAHATELQETKDFASKLEAATKAEVDRLESAKNAKADDRVNQIEARRTRMASLEDERHHDIETAKENLAIIKEMNAIRATLIEAEVELDEDGKELEVVPNLHGIIADLKANVETETDDRGDMETASLVNHY